MKKGLILKHSNLYTVFNILLYTLNILAHLSSLTLHSIEWIRLSQHHHILLRISSTANMPFWHIYMYLYPNENCCTLLLFKNDISKKKLSKLPLQWNLNKLAHSFLPFFLAGPIDDDHHHLWFIRIEERKMFNFLKGVVGGSGAGQKDLPYNIGDPYPSAWSSWSHFRGTSKVFFVFLNSLYTVNHWIEFNL